ncbi:MAG TPA: TRAP transporter large permease subunit, partial [Spirochaetes bacterium]|nr:TRAP transporter large permease subunit [Spirochaetota bacterium]
KLFGRVKAGIAISTVLVGALLAATTGVVGASVVAMGVIALPVMLKNKYSPELSCGVICASGTLGQIIPPSIVLIILGDVLQVPVGDLFKAAVIPGLILVTAYIVYILIYAYVKKDSAPALKSTEDIKTRWVNSLKAIVPPLVLIVLVLGSIFMGIATPTESAAVGGIGAVLLSLIYKEFTFKRIKESAFETVKITGMVFAIFIGATAFSLVFTETGGHEVVETVLLSLPAGKWGFIIFSMIAIFLLGFFIDFVEISYIVVPILFPIAQKLGIPMVWFGILLAMNLQTSFLTPPFGFSLFYLKGVAPPSIKTITIYKGVVGFILIQVAVLISVVLFPDVFGLTK